jgi:hypothetical protein
MREIWLLAKQTNGLRRPDDQRRIRRRLGLVIMRARFVIVALMLAVSAGSVHGQVLRGRVIEDGSEKPIATVALTLLRENGEKVSTLVTDSFGRFLIRPPAFGAYKLEGTRIGYRTATSPRFQVGLTDTLDMEFRLLPDAVLLAPLTVTASSRPWHELMKPPGVWPFYERKNYMQKLGLGKFITREDIDNWVGNVSSLLGTLPGVTVVQQRGGAAVQFRRTAGISGSGECVPTLYLNGAPVRGVTVDELVSTMDLEGVEVYRGAAQLPGEFAGSDSQCGVIVFWTRRG